MMQLSLLSNQNIQAELNLPSFLRFIFLSKENRYFLVIFLCVSTFLWLIFKWLYSIPYFSFDSYDYLHAAIYNIEPNHHPKGYSIILSIARKFTTSGLIFVSIQFYSLQFSLWILFFTIRFFIRINSWSSIALFIFFCLNPIFIDASNHIMSDIIFTSVSILWFTILIWIVYAPKPILVFIQAIIISLAFSLRYSALYYPFISTLISLSSNISWKWKISGLLIQYILIGLFIINTSLNINLLTGASQYSPFSGWKLANNALYMYSRIESSNEGKVPKIFEKLDSNVQLYFKNNHENFDLYDEEYTYGCYYIFSPLSPLVTHAFSEDGLTFTYKNYAKYGPLYMAYGRYLIKKHPIAFIENVIVPSLTRFINPHGELYDSLNLSNLLPSNNEDGQLATKWFKINLPSYQISTHFSDLRNALLQYCATIFTIINILYILSLITYVSFSVQGMLDKHGRNWIIITSLIWSTNLLFSSLSGPSVVRFELFTIILEVSCLIYIIELVYYHLNSLKQQP